MITTNLHHLCLRSNTPAVQNAIVSGIDPNKRNTLNASCLEIAIERGETEMARVLLVGGADPNAANPKTGQTPLLDAIEGGDAEIARVLLAGKADPNVPNPKTGQTPLLAAIASGNTEIVHMLFAANADPNVPNPKTGQTPLLKAATDSNEDMAKILMLEGADPQLCPAGQAQSPLDKSIKHKTATMLKIVTNGDYKLDHILGANPQTLTILPHGPLLLETLEHTTPALFFHILSIPHSEGGKRHSSLTYMEDILERFSKTSTSTSRIYKAAHSFTEGKTRLINKQASSTEHTIAIRVDEKTPQGTPPETVICVYNSGYGIRHHDQDGRKCITVKRFSTYKPAEDVWGDIERAKTIDEIYALDGYRPLPEEATDKLQTPQKIGNCYIEAFFSYLKQELDDETYLELRRFVFQDIHDKFSDVVSRLTLLPEREEDAHCKDMIAAFSEGVASAKQKMASRDKKLFCLAAKNGEVEKVRGKVAEQSDKTKSKALLSAVYALGKLTEMEEPGAEIDKAYQQKKLTDIIDLLLQNEADPRLSLQNVNGLYLNSLMIAARWGLSDIAKKLMGSIPEGEQRGFVEVKPSGLGELTAIEIAGLFGHTIPIFQKLVGAPTIE